MISKQLLEMLVCPETRQSLSPAPQSLIERLNRAIAARALRNQAGQVVENPLVAGLVRKDGSMLYPIIDDIPIMLSTEAIAVDPPHSDQNQN